MCCVPEEYAGLSLQSECPKCSCRFATMNASSLLVQECNLLQLQVVAQHESWGHLPPFRGFVSWVLEILQDQPCLSRQWCRSRLPNLACPNLAGVCDMTWCSASVNSPNIILLIPHNLIYISLSWLFKVHHIVCNLYMVTKSCQKSSDFLTLFVPQISVPAKKKHKKHISYKIY